MIKSWGNSATKRFAETEKSKFSGMNVDAAIDLLNLLNSSQT